MLRPQVKCIVNDWNEELLLISLIPEKLDNKTSTIAYFSMEIAVDPAIPTYSGGLGILAGDTLRAAADLCLSMVGMTLLYRKGYFRQHLDAQGNQTESAVDWDPGELLQPMQPRITVIIEGRKVQVRAWRYTLRGVSNHEIHVYFLDTALPENTALGPDSNRFALWGRFPLPSLSGSSLRSGRL